MQHTWLLTKEAAAYMRMHPDSVRKLIRTGELKAVKNTNSKTWRTRTDWCDAYLENTVAA